jgi:hypothetical protein
MGSGEHHSTNVNWMDMGATRLDRAGSFLYCGKFYDDRGYGGGAVMAGRRRGLRNGTAILNQTNRVGGSSILLGRSYLA